MLEGDLWEFYRLDLVDVFRGRLSARRVWAFIPRLMDEPMSRLRAELNGDEWLGYSSLRQAADDIYNAIGVHVQVTAGERKPSMNHAKLPPHTQRKSTTNVANFNLAGLAKQINQ